MEKAGLRKARLRERMMKERLKHSTGGPLLPVHPGLADEIMSEIRGAYRLAHIAAIDRLEAAIEELYPEGQYRRLLDPANDWPADSELWP